MGRLSLKSNIPQLESRIRFRPCIGVLTIPLSQGLLRQSGAKNTESLKTCHPAISRYSSSMNSPGVLPTDVRKKRVKKTRTGCCQEGQKKHVASENVSCRYFTLLVQHEFAGSLADRCAEETGEEGMILET